MNYRSKDFADYVNNDIEKYLELQKTQRSCVLLFPPVDNYKRFLIHNSVADTEDLCSFSIGQGIHRRTVICDKGILIRPKSTNGCSWRGDYSGKILVQKQLSDTKENGSDEQLAVIRERNKDKRRPDRQVYVPKAARQTEKLLSKEPEEERPIAKQIMSSKKNGSAPKAKSDKPPPVQKAESTDSEGDWDSMYADDGACLDPKIVEELTSAVGKVKIVPATSTIEAEVNEVDDGEFGHVLEISNFPVEFKTQDLMMVFSAYKDKEIKWVDDTHALVVFSSARIANEVLTIKYPGVRLKRLKDASAESISRAKRSGAAMLPFKARPETCASLARRLVSGALGVKSRPTKDVLEKEKRILQEARERKLAQKEQKDIWDDDDDQPS